METIQCYNCDIDDKDTYSGHNTRGIHIMFRTSTNYSVVKVCGFTVESSDKKVETIATSVEYRPSIGTDVLTNMNTNYDYHTNTSNGINNNVIISATRVNSFWLVDNDDSRLISEDT